MQEKLTYKADDLVEILGVSRPMAYRLCHQAGFPSFRVGRKMLISADGLRRWIEAQTVEVKDV